MGVRGTVHPPVLPGYRWWVPIRASAQTVVQVLWSESRAS